MSTHWRASTGALVCIGAILVFSACQAEAPVLKASNNGLSVEIEPFDFLPVPAYRFEDRCGIGVHVTNVASTSITFAEDDLDVFVDAAFQKWNEVYDEETRIDGYGVLGAFPNSLAPGEDFKMQLVVPCGEGPVPFAVVTSDGQEAAVELDLP